MDLVSTPLAVVLTAVGVLTLAAAAWVGMRDPLPPRAGGPPRWSLLVPWIGTLLVIVLLVRGALAGAVFVGVATLLYVGAARARSGGSS